MILKSPSNLVNCVVFIDVVHVPSCLMVPYRSDFNCLIEVTHIVLHYTNFPSTAASQLEVCALTIVIVPGRM